MKVRALFPALAEATVRLDGPAGSQTPQPVLDAITGYLTTRNANMGAVFSHSLATAEVVAQTRTKAARFLGASSPEEVVFGLNATSLNLTLSRWATQALRPGDEVIVTTLDHDSNIAPWTQAAEDLGLTVRTIGIGADTRLDLAALAAALSDRTRIVAFPYANNGIGTAVDVAAVVELAHRAGALAWADLTHWAPHAPAQVAALGVDVAICSAYKFFGPHVGLAYVRGGAAGRFEHGTLPFESLAGLSAALDYLDSVGWAAIAAHETQLGQRFLDGIPEGWRLHGVPAMSERTATFALSLPGHHPVSLAKALAAQGIAAGAGRFHSGSVFDAIGLPDGALRIGFLHYNTADEVDRVIGALKALSGGK
ncbi:aminotransferase class V-fold PLP-dependent enzyme [Catelliglobosispora koreensis]|uniref:aminotransferase class V-fold PLP-dependent enzyme n=1 Tax=Catelliglobosispora koreensis TaxID=129052 RepID=UPI00036A0256|nr:aminotransferase class V-fold PLP-dependent enzyme [Catelliglobosispora koreensis]